MDGFIAYTQTTADAEPGMTEPGLTEADLIRLIAEAFPSPRRQLERFKELMTERYGFDFEKRCMILSEELAEAIGLELPEGASPIRDGVGTSPFVEGLTFYVMEKSAPLIYRAPPAL